MTVGFILFMASITVAAFIFILLRVMPWRWIIKMALPIDVVFSVLMLCGGAGSATGLAVAITAGLMLSVVLYVAKRTYNGATVVKRRWYVYKEE